MEERKDSSLAPSLVSGRLEGISVPDLVWNVCRRRATGVLQLSARGTTKKIYVDDGRIIFAASSDTNDRLGEMLLREGVITLDQLEQAIVKLAGGKRLGTLLVEAGHLSPDNLVRGVLSQVRAIVLGLFSWEDGEYAFLEGPLPTAEVVTLTMRTPEVLLQGIRQIRSFSRMRRSVGPPTTRVRLFGGWRTTLDGLEIRDGERMLLQRIEEAGERGISIDRLCREVFLSNYEIYQALLAFRVLGILEEAERITEIPAGAVLEGRLSRLGLPDILVRLAQDGETGVLHVAQGSLERTFHVRDGVCVFATSNAIDDGLVAHLLRRGVISLSDREETARRLLSNKRVGTILLEMGVIDETDLRATVKEQLSEIVFDTFRWDAGDFRFAAGDLPTVEDITLDRSVEDLVFAGVRRVTSWTRVRDGCGGINARLVLRAEYLAVLDKMSVGAEEWELISLLKQPKSVAEVCRQSVLGDFRSCQILWALRLLGAIGEAPLEQTIDAALGEMESRPVEAVAPSPEDDTPFEVVVGNELPDAPVPVESETSVSLSEADPDAELISEQWRLAADRPKGEDRPEATPAVLPEEVEAPRFEMAEPGSGLEDMNVDMPPAPTREFEIGEPTPEAGDFHVPDSAVAAPALEIDDPEKGSDPISAEPEPAPLEPVSFVAPEPAPMPVPRPEPVPAPAPAAHLDQTTRISPEEIEAALGGPPAPPPEPEWELPAEVDAVIASFNARHAVLFRALRAEVGAGAANFVRSCRGALGNGFGSIFASVEL
ncbi:MAG TPA: DUF4388 domain-containing protein, partial [Candidatus Polarisedimenticolaceae bacterium]|nr:DUF4388 domain-containing protein [Candidatus Polarisedimenticolaceae bacterium]